MNQTNSYQSNDHSIGWGDFSESPEADYLRFIEDKNLTISINYLAHNEDTVRITFEETGIDGLSDEGKEIYLNDED